MWLKLATVSPPWGLVWQQALNALLHQLQILSWLADSHHCCTSQRLSALVLFWRLRTTMSLMLPPSHPPSLRVPSLAVNAYLPFFSNFSRANRCAACSTWEIRDVPNFRFRSFWTLGMRQGIQSETASVNRLAFWTSGSPSDIYTWYLAKDIKTFVFQHLLFSSLYLVFDMKQLLLRY